MSIVTESPRIPVAQSPLPRTFAARESYELLSTIFAGSTDLVFAKDHHGRYLNLNAAVATYFGRSIDEIVGRTDWDLLPPDRARFIAATDRLVLSTGENASYEVRAPRGDGVTWIYTTKAPVRDDQGRIVGMIGIGRDITARKQAEEAQRLSETRLAAAQAIAHLGGWEWNLRTDDVVWSAECYRIFGIEPQTFISTYASVVHLFHPGDAERFRGALAAAVRGKVAFKDDFRIIRPTGEERHIQVEGVVTQHGEDGAPLVISGTVRDITESKLTEIALRRSQANFAHAQRIAQVGSWEWEPTTGRTTWSEEASRIFGVTGDRLLMRPDFLEFVHPEDRRSVSSAIDATLSGETPYDLSFRIVRSDGTERIIHALGELHLTADNLQVMTGVCRDITDERRM
ncbi:MAG: PAS domain-containing protein, partial [Gammaproteobacteria bacterium]